MRSRLALLACLAFACRHAPPSPPAKPANAGSTAAGKPPPPPPPRPVAAAPPAPKSGSNGTVGALSEELRQLLRAQAELLWTRWTTGSGPLPASALADHLRLSQPDSVRAVAAAEERAQGDDALALRLLHQQLAALAIARDTAPEADAFDRARSQLAFSAPGNASADYGERDLDHLLTDERDARKRAAIAAAEAQAAQALAPLALARDAALARAMGTLSTGSWAELEEHHHGMTVSALADAAERTLALTEPMAARAVGASAERNLGIPLDRLRRADLPRLVRAAPADPDFPNGEAWPATRATLAGLSIQPDGLALDAEPSPSKGPRPLALLVDPPSDVRLSLRPAGGYEEQRATLHEAARAVGGTLVRVPRWELAQLGDASATEAAAQLFEELAAEPQWLRERTKLRGEPLDELVHTQAARRLLAARRAAALVLFEIRRREGAPTAEAQATLYRGLVQRASFAVLSDADANRWALESDAWIRTAPALLGAILAAQIEEKLTGPAGEPWWRSPAAPDTLRALWRGGRSLTAVEAARALGLASLDPQALAAVAERRLSYQAPEAPPPTQRPDYKYMQGDKKRRKKRHRR